MRRAFWLAAAVIGLGISTSDADAGHWHGKHHGGHYAYGGEPMPYVNGTYGLKVRGGYGVNGYAPYWGPVWGTAAFAPPYAMGKVPPARGSYVRPLYAPEVVYEEPVVPQQAAPEPPAADLPQ